MIWVKIQFWLAQHLIFRTKKHSIMLFPGIWWRESWKIWLFNNKPFSNIPNLRQFFFGGFVGVFINNYLGRKKVLDFLIRALYQEYHDCLKCTRMYPEDKDIKQKLINIKQEIDYFESIEHNKNRAAKIKNSLFQ